jgi:hypothetical protein
MATLDSMMVGDALARYYDEHRLPADGGESATIFRVRIGPLTIPLPNPPARRRAVFFHDVNHVLTGYNTVFSDGEVVIAGFEIGAGCGRVWIAWYINLAMMAFGVLLRPRATFRAFVRGRHSGSIYRGPDAPVVLRRMSVAEARDRLRIAPVTADPGPADRVAFGLWTAFAWLTVLVPTAAVAAIGWWTLLLVT